MLAGHGVVHLSGTATPIRPGTSIYLPPYQPHDLENTGSVPLEVAWRVLPGRQPGGQAGDPGCLTGSRAWADPGGGRGGAG